MLKYITQVLFSLLQREHSLILNNLKKTVITKKADGFRAICFSHALDLHLTKPHILNSLQ